MDQFYIITNTKKDLSMEVTNSIKNYIESKEKTAILATDVQGLPKGTDCVLVIGGDGTLIRAARELHSYDVPILGINMGTLGYLAEAELHNIEETLDQVMFGETQVEKRMMLQGVLNGQIEEVALNDIVLTRWGALKVVHFRLYVNGKPLITYQADGLIISTPTGSTAYNLSAGGPIVEPTASLFVITPICSHALNTSSIVLSAEDEIALEVLPDREGNVQTVGLSFDGECNFEMKTGDSIIIKKSEAETELLKLSNDSFLDIMRRKMKGN